MRRKIELFLLLLLVAASTSTGVQASTDCERWIASYKAQLEQAKAVKKLQAAHARLKHAAQHKMAVYVKKPTPPARPRPFLVSAQRPKLTPEQLLKRLEELCGDLPEESKNSNKLDTIPNGPPPLFELASDTPFPLIPSDDDGVIPSGDLPPYVPPGMVANSPVTTGLGGFGPYPILGGGGGNGSQVVNNGGGDTPPGGGGVTPVGVVPEPESLALFATGALVVAGVVRRRGRR